MTPTPRRRKFTLEEAVTIAFREGLAPPRYADLDREQLMALLELAGRTTWRDREDPRGGQARLESTPRERRRIEERRADPRGGWVLSFYEALRRAAYRRSMRLRRQNRDRFSKTDRLEIDASSLWEQAGRSGFDRGMQLYRETSDMLDVLADAYEEENDVHGAATARERARMARARADEIESWRSTR